MRPNRFFQQPRTPCRQSIGPSTLFVLLFLLLGGWQALAQQDQYEPPPLPVDPTPLVDLVTAKERADLQREAANPRKLVEIYLEIADNHLDDALAAIKADDYKTSERELDIYNKAIAEVTRTAAAQKDNRRKMGKKIEQEIFQHLKTLEAIERYFPHERAPFIEYALTRAKQARTQALNMTFDAGEILKDPATGNKKTGRAPLPGPHLAPPLSVGRYLSLRPVSFREAAREGRAQDTDYLTEEEDDFVRQAQDPELRARVFMKIADRRLEAITGKTIDPNDKKAQKKAEEDERRWGTLPKLERVEYLRHYARALDEVMIKLEDAYERNPKAKAFGKALDALVESTDRQLATLKTIEAQVTSEAEKRALKNAVEKADIANQGAREKLKSIPSK